jgi:hypothetical protein
MLICLFPLPFNSTTPHSRKAGVPEKEINRLPVLETTCNTDLLLLSPEEIATVML